jgi:carboxymethylenebutenolidase
MIGARGREGVRDFYANHFLPQLPPDIEIVPVSRTIGQSQVVDEVIIRSLTRLAWTGGIAPTGKRVQVPLVAIMRFEGDKIVREHQIAAQVLDPSQPMNQLIHRGVVKENGTNPKKRARAAGG